MSKSDIKLSDEEIARRRDEVIRRMANTPPQPHKPLGKINPKVGASEKARPSKKYSETGLSHLEIVFDTESFDEELKRLGALVFKNFLETRGSVCLDLSFDIFVNKNVPAATADSPGQLSLGLRISGSIKKDAMA